MRPLKFRAWDGEKFVFDEPGLCVICRYDHEAIEQFTGLHDRDGVEIYEGDVVKFIPPCNEGYPQEITDWETGIVEFDSGTYKIKSLHQPEHRRYTEYIRMWKDGTNDWYGIENVEHYRIEVIGNIHQNPELLNVSRS